jgi:hypothetical protein
MFEIPITVAHPMNPENLLKGCILQKGDTIQEGDQYPSTTGVWEEVPPQDVGTTVTGDGFDNTIFVRPLAKESPIV